MTLFNVVLSLYLDWLVVVELIVVAFLDSEIRPGFLGCYELLVMLCLVLKDLIQKYLLAFLVKLLRRLLHQFCGNYYWVMSFYIYSVHREEALNNFVWHCDRIVAAYLRVFGFLFLNIIKYFVHVGFRNEILFVHLVARNSRKLSRDVTAKLWVFERIYIAFYKGI